MTKRSALGVGVAMIVTTAASGCGYALAGRSNSLPTHIQVIGVPNFTTRATEPDIDKALTDAVRSEFQSKGKYRVEPDDNGVDAVLTGVIMSVTLQPTAFDTNRRPTAYAIVVMANVEFKDLKDDNKILWANPSFRVTDDYQIGSGATPDTTAIFGQNAQARDRLAKKFARDVVTSILEAF